MTLQSIASSETRAESCGGKGKRTRSTVTCLEAKKSYGTVRLDRACQRALSYGLCSYRRIQNMLKLGLEEEQEQ